MTLFHDKDVQFAYIVGQYQASGNCTNVIGGRMTAGTADAAGSNLITFSPPFISAPRVFLTMEGLNASVVTAGNCPLLTGVTVSNCYIQTDPTLSGSQGAGQGVNIAIFGLQRL